MRPTMLAALLVTTAACELPTQQWSPLLPDDRLLVVSEDDATRQARALGEPSEYAQTLADVTDQANQGIGEVLELVQTITTLPPSYVDSRASLAVWGPFIIDGTAVQLTIQEQPDTSLRWGVQVRSQEEASPWIDALVGHVDAGATAETSTGHFSMDFAAAEVLELGEDLSGQVEVQYSARNAGATTDITFAGLGETATVPIQGTIHFDHDRGVGGEMITTLEDDVDGSASEEPETVSLRARWDAQGAGRTDATLTGGDFGTEQHAESECWSPVRTVVYYTNTFQGVSDGDEEQCTFVGAALPE